MARWQIGRSFDGKNLHEWRGLAKLAEMKLSMAKLRGFQAMYTSSLDQRLPNLEPTRQARRSRGRGRRVKKFCFHLFCFLKLRYTKVWMKANGRLNFKVLGTCCLTGLAEDFKGCQTCGWMDAVGPSLFPGMAKVVREVPKFWYSQERGWKFPIYLIYLFSDKSDPALVVKKGVWIFIF